ncbi:RagB/SusD family nutrient uptake outer membrane protein [Pseudocnuella soli]|uniref:RagB/SusD family nutrient uptake outer membrane protein n=1 Tax=Pseudocnuella soli TaxID=2502779 RepID=UPI001045D5DB|nr:RagB/SusD family nutrient uptake outer membrane protein [Pseudocnuella soli]
MEKIKRYLIIFFSFLLFSCTKLDENFRSSLSQNDFTPTAAELLTTAYNSMNGPFQRGDFWHIQQHTSDETIAPTRGPDWDDNGQWRALHAHTWDNNQNQINGAFSGLLSIQFNASFVLQYNPSPQQAAEAKFIRALSVFTVLDGWGQVPFREDLNDYRIDPKTLSNTEAADFIISEVTGIINALPDVPAYRANKDAARALLMKTYLNRGMFANRAAPTFAPADMAQVIALADQIIGSGRYSINNNEYFDHFAPNNENISRENIFTLHNIGATSGGDVRGVAMQVSHYNMNPSGWNGFSTLSDFYDKFEDSDKRRGYNYRYPGALPNPGNRTNVGFLIGQQYNLTTGAALQDRKGNPLTFSREVKIRETDENTLERTGIRVLKYPFDYATNADQKENDWVIFRYADVLLMKAEALLRTGKAAEGLVIVNQIRAARGATPLAALNEANLLDERGRELYWEGWRRQDLIRFGKFLQPWQEKAASDPRNLLFPIPANQLAVNPNLTQNPGY